MVDSRSIARNVIFLYLRTIIILLVSLYISRQLLHALGVIDLGIFNVVGGVVAIMAFFLSALSKSTSRFLAFAIGENSSKNELQRLFSSCITVHLLIALVAVIIGESFGLYLIRQFVNVPEERVVSAYVLFHISLIIFAIHITRIPFESIFIAYERMDAYAYFSIFEVFFQLFVVVFLERINGDRLLFYSYSLLIISVVIWVAMFVYTKINYSIYKIKLCLEWEQNKRILSFSGWTFCGSAANTGSSQGVAILLNNFVGLIANSALGFANQVNGAVGKFVSSFTTAFNPQIIKLYAANDAHSLYALINKASKYSFLLAYIVALPLIVNMKMVLKLWLVNVPDYTIDFCQLILICSLFDATSSVFNTAITATGVIRNYQIAISISFISDFIFAFLLLLCHFNPSIVFGSRIATRGIANMIIGLHFCKKQIGFSISNYLHYTLLPIMLVISASLTVVFVICIFCEYGWTRLLLTSFISIFIIIVLTYYLIMDDNERNRITKIGKKVLLIWREKFFVLL